MVSPEHVELPSGLRYLRNAYATTPFRDRTSRLHAWSVIEQSAENSFGPASGKALQGIAEYRMSKRQSMLQPGIFHDFIVFVGEQGSGKETMANELTRRNYYKLTMSDIVRAVAPDFGCDPTTTQGKIDAGHAFRKMFYRSVIMKLSMLDALESGQEKLVVDGPRSMYEVRAARAAGARIIGLIADSDRVKDRNIRFDRVVHLRSEKEQQRVVTSEDFFSRERQERWRSRRMLAVADTIVVTNRKAADLVDTLIKHQHSLSHA